MIKIEQIGPSSPLGFKAGNRYGILYAGIMSFVVLVWRLDITSIRSTQGCCFSSNDCDHTFFSLISTSQMRLPST